MSHRIFLSYSHHDGPFVEAVTKLIRATGTPVFHDMNNIPAGNLAMIRPDILYTARELKSILSQMRDDGWEILLSPG